MATHCELRVITQSSDNDRHARAATSDTSDSGKHTRATTSGTSVSAPRSITKGGRASLWNKGSGRLERQRVAVERQVQQAPADDG